MSKLQNLSEIQSKMILERINQAEKNVDVIAISLEGVIRKEIKFCNKIDELAKKFNLISEISDDSHAKVFESMAETMIHLADIEAIKISRIEEKVLSDLMQYEAFCKNTRDEAKKLITLRDVELSKRNQINLNKKSRKNILVENEAMLSNIQISKVLKELLSTAEKFENRKFIDMKEVLLNYILIQLKYFASGIEILTFAFENINNSCESSEHFTKKLKNINKQFKKHIENDNLQGYNRFPLMRALSRFSHSTSNVDLIGKTGAFNKKDIVGKAHSTMSLNSLESNASEVAHQLRKNFPIDHSTQSEKCSDSDETDIDDSSNMEPTDTENSQAKGQHYSKKK